MRHGALRKRTVDGATRGATGYVIPAAVTAAAVDDRLQPRDLVILVTIWGELDPTEFRPVKHRWLADRSRIHRRSVLRALNRLLAHGYLKRRRRPGDLCLYRMAFCTLPIEAQRKLPRRQRTQLPPDASDS